MNIFDWLLMTIFIDSLEILKESTILETQMTLNLNSNTKVAKDFNHPNYWSEKIEKDFI